MKPTSTIKVYPTTKRRLKMAKALRSTMDQGDEWSMDRVISWMLDRLFPEKPSKKGTK